jgi:hypothetical protein
MVARTHAVPHGLAAVDGAHQVHVQHQPEVVERHLRERLVAQDAGVVDEDVHPPPGVHGAVDHRLHRRRVAHVGAVDHRLTPVAQDLVDHRARRRAGGVTVQVVDDHARAMPGEFQRVRTPQPDACSGDDRHLVLQILAQFLFLR